MTAAGPGREAAEREAAARWLDAYIRAWTTNDPAEIGSLFATDARYLPSPWSAPWSGREAIVREWLARRDDPGSWRFDGHVLAVDGDLAVVVGTTVYLATASSPETTYANLWLVRIRADGSAGSFEEWWITSREGQPSGTRQSGEGA